MSEKRRDHRGRILHNGEIQLSDGRYRFKYVDEMGKERCVYSWRLDHNDATPKGMLMCHKVTHKKLIDNSPLFRKNFKVEFHGSHTNCVASFA